ncbi:MAG: class I SAM-dependent methyltransferase [Chromatiaceae bacterium]|jgi:SAM-dependent methyltransferase|nr:class I SAM-dependent methyltransferase [Chromatiaceae bacterium]
MSGFSADWLALREPLDEQARSAALARLLRRRLGTEAPLRILDLATGTGSNLRWLAPRLGGSQEWLLVDHDPKLLAALPRALAQWAGRHGYAVESTGGALMLSAPGFQAVARTLPLDLAGDLDALPLTGQRLVTASALLDLVSERWLRRLAEHTRAEGCDLLFALTYDGRMDFDPPERGDERIRGLVNRHQLRDKGFGPALGPAATERADALLARLGYRVWTRRSDWRIPPNRASAQAVLLNGWTAAAQELRPGPENDLWLALRQGHLRAARSFIRVGHRDLLALLPP